jgi:thiol-disulfide isomerase/thioredoxin
LLTAVFAAVILVGLGVAWVLGRGEQPAAEVGGQAPQFSATLFDGTTFDLEAHLADDGRPVVLNLWASWCDPCRDEIPELSAWAEANPDAIVIGMAVEDVEDEARSLAAELSPMYGVGLGDTEFRASYPSLGLPVTYFIDSSGEITDFVNGILTEDRLDQAVATTG